MRISYFCESCEKEFVLKKECLEHEEECKRYITQTCHCCGNTEVVDMKNPKSIQILNSWHAIYLGRQENGSKLDGSDVFIDICDNCLYNFINNFVHKDKILNSGCNAVINCPEEDDSDDERPCTPAESLRQSIEEVKLIREGKLKAKTWDELYNELKHEEN